MLSRVARAWRALAPDQQLAALAAAVLLLSMFLPWYEKDIVVGRGRAERVEPHSVTAFGGLSFVEPAILLVVLGVLALLFFRGERRAFHLPGGDGTVVLAAGVWVAFLLFVRVTSRSVQWGFVIALLTAGLLAYAGYRMRAADRAEPTAAQDPTTRVEPTPLPAATARTRAVPARARPRGRTSGPDAPTQVSGQLSFEEHDEPPA